MLLRLVRFRITRRHARQRRPARKIALIERALANLPSAQRRAYRLRCVERVGAGDAAALLGIGRDELEQNLAAALAAIACALDEQ